jgi:phage baseplate assembly protein W
MVPTKDFNILFPKVSTGSSGKDFAVVSNYNMYVQQIYNLCNTQKGEHVNYNFGCNLFDFIFDPLSNKHVIETTISSSIEAFINTLSSVKTSLIYYDENLLKFDIFFYIRTGLTTESAYCTIEVKLT